MIYFLSLCKSTVLSTGKYETKPIYTLHLVDVWLIYLLKGSKGAIL